MQEIGELAESVATTAPSADAVRRFAPAFCAGPRLDPEAFARVRRALVLDACKWDPQVGDVATLASFPLVLRADVWDRLARWAERLSGEAVAAEREILDDARLLRPLGLPHPLRRVLAWTGDGPDDRPTPAAARVMRFDFHLTAGSQATGGWQISEANADVPGGFSEASAFPALMASHFPELQAVGDPAAAWADAVVSAARERGPVETASVRRPAVALLCAAGYMEDQQVVSFLAARLRERGLEAMLAGPRDLRWRDGRAWLDAAWHRGPLAAVVRFYQGEWLARLPRRAGWERLFRGGRTPVVNPGGGIVIESKRFPLVWDALRTPLPTWRMLLPDTRDPRDAPWRTDEGWLLKAAFCNTGDWVCAPGWVDARRWRSAAREARWFPWNWVAQRRFDAVPLETPDGPMYPCLGVYTVSGRAAGIYGRLSRGPVVDYAAVDVAVLLT